MEIKKCLYENPNMAINIFLKIMFEKNQNRQTLINNDIYAPRDGQHLK